MSAIKKLNMTFQSFKYHNGQVPAEDHLVLSMARTAVYANFNAAVELEYMHKWSQTKKGRAKLSQL